MSARVDSVVPIADIVDEARRVVSLAAAGDVVARLLGGTAVAMTARPQPALTRSIKDIDLVIGHGLQDRMATLLGDAGYRPNERFNVLRGDRRLLFFDDVHERQLDVFVGEFAMCHRLELSHRLELGAVALPAADLLLTKLQTIELNEKDLFDICALLLSHPIADGDDGSIDGARVAAVCGADWGWHRTVGLTLERVVRRVDRLRLSAGDQSTIRERIVRLRAVIDDHPKTGRWRRRALIGDRRRWYEQPEEVD